MKQTVAAYIAKTLEQAGVKRIWGVTGDSLNGLSDSLNKMKTIEWMPTRHEEVAAFAAGAEAQLTGELAVCAGSCGPGNLHLINGLFDCHRNHVPVLAIAAHIPSSEIGSGYFQETHPQELFRECSHYCELVSSPEQIPQVLAIAMRKAILNRGVSVVVLPGDVALKAAPETATTHWYSAPQPTITPADEELKKLAQLLRYSSNIALMCGSGCAGAHKELVEFAAKLKAPVVHALRGKEHVEYDNPYDVGMTGLIGFSSGFHTMMNADTLILLGTQFPYRAFYPTDAKIIQIDINPGSIGAHSKVDMALIGDIKSTLAALLPLLEEKTDRKFLDKALSDYRDARKGLDDLAKPSEKSDPPAVSGAADQPLRRRRCHLHLRRGYAHRLGRALSENERQTTPAWLVQPWLNGQRHAAGAGRKSDGTGTSGGGDVRRRRVQYADGGFPVGGADEASAENRGL